MTTDPNDLFRPLMRRRAFEDVIVQVEQAIENGSLRQGDRLPTERQLAETLGVSRASVREALRVLEMFGVVVARPGTGPDSGSFVSSRGGNGLTSALRFHATLSGTPTEDFVDIRTAIERHTARRAADLRDDASIERLRDLIPLMRQAKSHDEFHRIDTDFHIAVASASQNLLAPVMMEALRVTMSRAMLRGWQSLPDVGAEQERLTTEHEAITNCIAAGDADGAESAMEQHISRFYRLLRDHVDEPAPRPTRSG